MEVSAEGASPAVVCEAEKVLACLVDSFEPEKALVLVFEEQVWRAAARLNLPQDGFWSQDHLSIGAITDVAVEGRAKLVADSAQPPEFLVMGGSELYAVLATPAFVAGVPAVLYLSRSLGLGIYQEQDLTRLSEFAASLS